MLGSLTQALKKLVGIGGFKPVKQLTTQKEKSHLQPQHQKHHQPQHQKHHQQLFVKLPIGQSGRRIGKRVIIYLLATIAHKSMILILALMLPTITEPIGYVLGPLIGYTGAMLALWA